MERLLPEEERSPRRRRGCPWLDPREVSNGILWVLRTGSPWKDLPDRYPPYQTCRCRFQRRVRTGLMETILRAMTHDLKAARGSESEGVLH
ncbi:transposase [Thermodesulforhabdus norvegica]|uniref:transposase n=1 Tax=Thermodesulforhabdus norvegica TaxID=39841 RepID=UPI0031831964